MRVLHVTPYFAPAFIYGGPPRSILGLCRGLQDAGVDVQVFTTSANGTADLPAATVAAESYEGVPVRYFSRTFPRRFFGVGGLRTALAAASAQYDVIHIHGLWNLPAWIAARHARRCHTPYVLSPRGMLEPGALALRSARKQIAYRLVERRNLAGAALLHATGPGEARRLAERGLGVDIVTLPNGVDLPVDDRLAPGFLRRRAPAMLADTPVVAFLGRIHPIKRLDLLAATFERVGAQHPSAQLVIAGPDEDGHRRIVEPLFTHMRTRVHWVGELDQDEKWSLLADADVIVLCSASENFGMSAAEALAAGTPVVVTRTCPWSDVETHGCGFWVDSDAEAIAAGVLKLLQDPARAQQMGARGRALIRDRYSWAAIGRAMAGHYVRIVARANASGSVA